MGASLDPGELHPDGSVRHWTGEVRTSHLTFLGILPRNWYRSKGVVVSSTQMVERRVGLPTIHVYMMITLSIFCSMGMRERDRMEH